MVEQSVECQTRHQEIERLTSRRATLCSTRGQVIDSYVSVMKEYNLVIQCGWEGNCVPRGK